MAKKKAGRPKGTTKRKTKSAGKKLTAAQKTRARFKTTKGVSFSRSTGKPRISSSFLKRLAKYAQAGAISKAAVDQLRKNTTTMRPTSR